MHVFFLFCSSHHFPANPAGQSHVLHHDGDPSTVNGHQVGVLKQANEVGLTRFLKSSKGRSLEAQLIPMVFGNLPHQALKGKLANEQLSAPLVPANLTKSNGTRPVTMRLLLLDAATQTTTTLRSTLRRSSNSSTRGCRFPDRGRRRRGFLWLRLLTQPLLGSIGDQRRLSGDLCCHRGTRRRLQRGKGD